MIAKIKDKGWLAYWVFLVRHWLRAKKTGISIKLKIISFNYKYLEKSYAKLCVKFDLKMQMLKNCLIQTTLSYYFFYQLLKLPLDYVEWIG